MEGNGGSDKLRSDTGDDNLFGNDGQDTLAGGGGNNYLMGSEGADRLIGGRDGDSFIFDLLSDSDAAHRDVIKAGSGASAFQGADAAEGDIIELRDIDADTTTPGCQEFLFGGTGTGHLSPIDAGVFTVIRGNVDDDCDFELQIVIKDGSVRASAYTIDDFLQYALDEDFPPPGASDFFHA